jgi:hypothetical protein
MDQEKSSLDILKEFAEKTGRECQSYKSAKAYLLTPSYHDKSQFAIIPEEKQSKVSYIAYDSYGSRGKIGGTYSGVFIPLELADPDFWLEVRLKDALDKFKGLFSSKGLKVGHPPVDQVLFITGTDKDKIAGVFTDAGVYNEIIDLCQTIDAFRFSVNRKEVDFLNSLAGKPCLALYTTYDWIREGALIERLFTLARRIKDRMALNKII